MFDRFTRTLRPLIVRCAQSMALPSAIVKASALSLLATASLTLAAQAPVATITSASPVTTGVAGLTASVPVQSGATYAWTISGGTITAGATTASITYTAGATGTLTLGCTVTASDSTTATGTKSISVVAAPVATITAASTVTTGIAGWNASVPALTGATFAWTITGGTITSSATAVAVSYTAGPVGTITLSCTVTNTAGTSATGTKTVSVVAPPTAPVVTAASPVTTGVTGQTASASTQSGVTYTWTATGATITAGQGTTNITYTPTAVGTATLNCKATNAAGTFATGSTSVSVIAAPVVPVITSASPVATGTTGLTASIPAQSGMTYAWVITGGTLASGQGTTSVTYSADVVGIVTLSCTATNATGTSKTGTAAVMATPTGIMDISGTYHDGFGATFTIYQNGTSVWSTRTWNGGGIYTDQIQGTISGTTFSGTISGYDNGTVSWTFASDASSYTGYWIKAGTTTHQAWTGTRQAGVTIQLTPTSALMATGAAQPFMAYVAGVFDKSINWTTTAGSIDANGVLTAPPAPGGNFVVTATSGADPTKSASAKVMATPNGVMDISGTYKDNFNYTFTLYQSGTHVWGTRVTGTFDATMNGNVLSGNDYDSSGAVTVFTWTFAPDASTYSGLYAVAPATPNLAWTGTKQAGVSVQISPTSVLMQTGAAQAFRAYVAGAFDKTITWTATGGTVDATGLLTAPPAPGGNFMVTATSGVDGTKSATAKVMATPNGVMDISGTYTDNYNYTFTLFQSGTHVWGTRATGTFDATVTGNVLAGVDKDANGTVTVFSWTFAPDASSYSGLYAVAPATPNLAWTGTKKAGVSLQLSPLQSVLTPTWSESFLTYVAGAFDKSISWSVQEVGGGSVTANGSYTAPGALGTFHVIAAPVAAPTVTGTATIQVAVVGLETLPIWTSLRPGAAAAFTATIQGVAVTGVTWSVQEGAAGGSVDATGHYTAPSAPGTYHVVATSIYDPTAKSAAVVQVGATANAFVTITPYVSQLGQGGSQQFTATVTDAANPAVTWSCSGGTIDANGLYTSPSSYGNYTVTATSVEDPTATDTVTVIVSSGTGTDASFTYDGNGNMTSDGSRTFEYDVENRLTAVTILATGHRSEFGYDGFGRRVEIVEKDNAQITQDTKYVWEGAEILESRSSDGGTTLQKYFGQGFVDSDGTDLYYTRDHLGSVRELVDMQGAVRARYDYDPYGRMTKISGDRDSVFGYTGHFWHGQSGLFLTLFRAYDPNLGRWLTRDPIEENGGLNVYGYVQNAPINKFDLLGLRPPDYTCASYGFALLFGVKVRICRDSCGHKYLIFQGSALAGGEHMGDVAAGYVTKGTTDSMLSGWGISAEASASLFGQGVGGGKSWNGQGDTANEFSRGFGKIPNVESLSKGSSYGGGFWVGYGWKLK